MYRPVFKFLCCFGVLFLSGCGTVDYKDEEPRTAKQAIQKARRIQNPHRKVDYLLKTAQRFLDNFSYAEAFDLAHYVLDRDPLKPMHAKIILDQAKKGIRERDLELEALELEKWAPSK